MAEKHSSIQDTTLFSEYTENLSAIEPFHVSFDEKEQIFMGKPIDKITQEETSSKLTDPTLVSAIIKQNNTVMAQMPTGKVTALSVKNKGKSLFMDLILHKHILPNAMTQYDVFTKYWLMSLYRKIYGSMGVLVDYVNKTDADGKGYIGADFSLIPIRGIIPQKGKTTIEDSDYIDIRTQVTRSYLQSVMKKEGWNSGNITKVLESDGDSMSGPTTNQQEDSAGTQTKGMYEIVTRYYRDKWVTFHPGKKLTLRSIKNQHKNNKIPVIMCYAYPLMDRFFGLGDVERGTALHNALGGLINLYMQGVKMSIFPERLVDPSSVENWGDIIKNGILPGQIWLMGKQDFDGMRQMPINPAGIQSFQSTYSFLKGAIMTLTNTTDTSMDAKIDPGFGKTPQALKMQAMTQGQQSQFDRRMLELSIEKINDRLIDLVSRRQEKPIVILLQKEDLQKVADVSPDALEMFETDDMGKVTIKATDIKDEDYRYDIDQGSTVKKDELVENEGLSEVMELIKSLPGALEQSMQTGMVTVGTMEINMGELLKRWIITKGITDWDKIITERIQEPGMEQGMMAQQGMEGMQGMEGNAMNIENPNGMAMAQQLQSGQYQHQDLNDTYAELEALANG